MPQSMEEKVKEIDARTGDPAPFGQELRHEREMREISIREISDTTKISSRFLEAIEAGDFSSLPAPVFTRGFIREYASYLGIEPEEIVDRYMRLVAREEERLESEEAEMRERISGRFAIANVGPGWKFIVFALLAVVILAAIIYFVSLPRTPVEPVIAAPVAAPESIGEAAEPEQPLTADRIEMTLDATADSWINLQVDDEDPIEFTLQAGGSRSFEANQRIVLLTVGNAGGVNVTLNGVNQNPLGRLNQVVRNVEFDLAEVNELLAQRREEAGGDEDE